MATTVNIEDRFPIADTKDLRYPYFRGLEYLANLPTDKPRMIKSHFQYSFLPDDIQERKKGRVRACVDPDSGSAYEGVHVGGFFCFIFSYF